MLLLVCAAAFQASRVSPAASGQQEGLDSMSLRAGRAQSRWGGRAQGHAHAARPRSVAAGEESHARMGADRRGARRTHLPCTLQLGGRWHAGASPKNGALLCIPCFMRAASRARTSGATGAAAFVQAMQASPLLLGAGGTRSCNMAACRALHATAAQEEYPAAPRRRRGRQSGRQRQGGRGCGPAQAALGAGAAAAGPGGAGAGGRGDGGAGTGCRGGPVGRGAAARAGASSLLQGLLHWAQRLYGLLWVRW